MEIIDNSLTVFSDGLEKIAKIAYDLSNKAQEIICKAYGDSTISLPIDIKKIAQYLNIKIEERDFSHYECMSRLHFAPVYAYSVAEKDNRTIIAHHSPLINKYPIAREIAKLLINDSEYNSYSTPLFYNTAKDFFADVLAAFLILPFNLVISPSFDTIKNKKEEDYFGYFERLVEELATKSMLPVEVIYQCMSYIRLAAYHDYKNQDYKNRDAKKILENDYTRKKYALYT